MSIVTRASGRLGATLALAAMWLSFFGGHLLSGGVPYYRDHLVTNIPLRQYIRERLLGGELPQWYPYESLGVPVIGQIALGTFHPFTFLFLPFSAPVAEKLALLSAYLMALVGAYRLARALPASRPASLAAAAAFGFGGYALGVSSIIAYAMSTAALPWVAYAGLRIAHRARLKDAALLGACWSLVFLSGDAVGFLLSCLIVAATLVAGFSLRKLGLALLGGVLASMLVGIEFLPATQVAADAIRAVGVPSPALGVTWALHPLRIPELLIAGYVPDPIRFRVVGGILGGGTAVFSTSVFAGGIALALAVTGTMARSRLSIAFAVLAAFGFWMALGDRAGLLPAVRWFFTVFSNFRYPERYLAFFWLGLCPLVAFGFDRVRRRPRAHAIGFLIGGATLGVAAALIAGPGVAPVLWELTGRSPLLDAEGLRTLDRAWFAGLGWTGLLLGAAGAITWLAAQRPSLLACLPLLLFAELWRGNGQQLPLIDPKSFEGANEFVRVLKERERSPEPLGRILQRPGPSFESTVTGPEGSKWVAAMSHLLRPDVAGMFHLTPLASNLGARTVRNGMLLDSNRPEILPMLNGCYSVGGMDQPAWPGEEVLATEPALGLSLASLPCLPRAFLAGAQRVESRGRARELLASGRLKSHPVGWEGGPNLAGSNGKVVWREAKPELLRLDVDVEGPSAAALVVTDEFAKGWSARVDGALAPIHPAMIAARGIELSPGRHQVVFEYRTPWLMPGVASSAAGLLGVLFCIVLGRRRSARQGSALPAPPHGSARR